MQEKCLKHDVYDESPLTIYLGKGNDTIILLHHKLSLIICNNHVCNVLAQSINTMNVKIAMLQYMLQKYSLGFGCDINVNFASKMILEMNIIILLDVITFYMKDNCL